MQSEWNHGNECHDSQYHYVPDVLCDNSSYRELEARNAIRKRVMPIV
jgi:hypothetical protein